MASGECRVASEKLESPLGDTRVFLCTSAEVVEGKGDELRFCTQMMCTGSVKVHERGSQGCSGKGLEGQPSGAA